MEIPSPAAGVVESIAVKLDDEVGTGDFILKLKVARRCASCCSCASRASTGGQS
jgi:pyruvate dehydrogenase E2 component (dihydrolipoamide acetyltransferase)